MPRSASPALAARFLPLTEHFAYEFDVDRQEDRVVRLRTLLHEADPALQRLLTDAGAADAELQLLDLHGMRAREAKDALRTCTEPISVVWFGKGSGVLREVFLEFLDARDDLVLVDMSGETRDRPQEAMGLILRDDLHRRLEAAIAKPAPRVDPKPTRPEPRPAPPAPPPSAPAPNLLSFVLRVLRALFDFLRR